MSKGGLRFYTQEESEKILQIAGYQQPKGEGFTHEDLVRAAAELQVPEAAIQHAESLIREQQSEVADRVEFKRVQLRKLLFQAAVCLVASVAILWRSGTSDHAALVFSLVTLLPFVLGIIFARSTKSEIEFLKWRSARKNLFRMRGKSSIQILLEFPWESGEFKSQADLVDYLIKKRIASNETEAWSAVEEFVRYHPSLAIPRGAAEPSD